MLEQSKGSGGIESLMRYLLRIKRRMRTKTAWARRDLNPRPTDYESAALTAELQAQQNPLHQHIEKINKSSILFITYHQYLYNRH